MGIALAEAVLRSGGEAVVVSGPITHQYPTGAEVHRIETTQQMLEKCTELFPSCDGVIGAAAPCDFKPVQYSDQKLTKAESDGELLLRLVPTPDILAGLGRIKKPYQWIVGFALETQHGKEHALEKLHRKNCDFVALNDPSSIDNTQAKLEIFDVHGNRVALLHGMKSDVAAELLKIALRK